MTDINISKPSKRKVWLLSFIRHLYNRPFVNRWLIFLLDVMGAWISSLLTYGFFRYTLRPFAANNDLVFIGVSLSVVLVIILLFATYKGVVRHSTLNEVNRIMWAMCTKSFLLYLTLWLIFPGYSRYVYILFFVDWAMSSFILVSLRSLVVNVYHRVIRPHVKHKQTWIYGNGPRSASLSYLLSTGAVPPYMPTLVITREKSQGLRLSGMPLRSFDDEYSIKVLMDTFGTPDVVIFPDSASVSEERDRLVEFCLNSGVELMMASDYEALTDVNQAKRRIREIRIEDLLGRPTIQVPMGEVHRELEGKVVMITGAAGSIGSEIVRQVARMQVKKLVLFDNAESPLHNIRLEIERKHPEVEMYPIIGDVRSEDRLRFVFDKFHPQYIFHAAAYKHVPLMEENPCEAVAVNVKGTYELAQMAVQYGVEKFVMVSTDKAVRPTNVMGSTKRVAEMIVQSMDRGVKNGTLPGRTRFITTRFGNVLGSNGSVIPLFRQQIEQGGPLTVTDPCITRFFMTIPEACSLVLEAGMMGQGGEIFAFDMGEAMKIDTLARNMIKLSGLRPDIDIKIEYVGLRPGEKLYEEVLHDKETTLPTHNPKIRVAKVRECEMKEVTPFVEKMIACSTEIKQMDTVAAIKELVPEFKSKNSPYEVLDK